MPHAATHFASTNAELEVGIPYLPDALNSYSVQVGVDRECRLMSRKGVSHACQLPLCRRRPRHLRPLTLSDTDRARLQTAVHRGHLSARTRTRAQVLLKLGEDWSDTAVGDAFDVCRNTVKRVRARFLEGGVDAVLTDKVQERRHQALTGEQQAHLIAIACSPIPEGHDHWTLR